MNKLKTESKPQTLNCNHLKGISKPARSTSIIISRNAIFQQLTLTELTMYYKEKN